MRNQLRKQDEGLRFSDLDPEVQQRVVDRWRENDSFPWYDEWKDALHRFEGHSPIGVGEWEVSTCSHSFVNFDFELRGYYGSVEGESEDWVDAMRGVRLWKYLRRTYARLLRKGDCPLTGYCADESLLGPIREAIAGHPAALKTTTLRDVMEKCINGWIREYQHDIEGWYSEEYIRDEIEANDYRFDEEGRLA